MFDIFDLKTLIDFSKKVKTVQTENCPAAKLTFQIVVLVQCCCLLYHTFHPLSADHYLIHYLEVSTQAC